MILALATAVTVVLLGTETGGAVIAPQPNSPAERRLILETDGMCHGAPYTRGDRIHILRAEDGYLAMIGCYQGHQLLWWLQIAPTRRSP